MVVEAVAVVAVSLADSVVVVLASVKAPVEVVMSGVMVPTAAPEASPVENRFGCLAGPRTVIHSLLIVLQRLADCPRASLACCGLRSVHGIDDDAAHATSVLCWLASPFLSISFYSFSLSFSHHFLRLSRLLPSSLFFFSLSPSFSPSFSPYPSFHSSFLPSFLHSLLSFFTISPFLPSACRALTSSVL